MADLRVTDALGNTYGVGDRVVYPTTSGHSPVLVVATVASIREKGVRTVRVPSGEHADSFDKVSLPAYRVGVHKHVNVADKGWRWTDRVSFPTAENIIAFPADSAAE